MTLEDIMDIIESNVPNVTDRLYGQALARAGSRFFRESGVWVSELDAVSLMPDVRRYDLGLPRGSNVVKFANVFYNGTEIYSDTRAQLHSNTCPYKYDREANTLLLYPTPSSAEQNAVVVRAVLVPDLRGETPPELDYYIDKYGDAIVAAACVFLCKMPAKNWTNNAAAANYEAEFINLVEQARVEGKGLSEKRVMSTKYQDY